MESILYCFVTLSINSIFINSNQFLKIKQEIKFFLKSFLLKKMFVYRKKRVLNKVLNIIFNIYTIITINIRLFRACS